MCDRSAAQLQQLEEQLAKEEKRKVDVKVYGELSTLPEQALKSKKLASDVLL